MDTKILTVEEIQKSLQRFGITDYIVFVLMLVGCAGVGVFYALRGSKNTDAATEYLMGGRNMKIFPISMSLVASFISGITLLGNPTEMYVYGTGFIFIFIGTFAVAAVGGEIFLPVFHDMKLSSTYEYLERRFDKNVRLFGSILFALSLMFWLPIVIYVPALAFNQVTGVNVHIITPCVCIVCIFYTAIGGLKAVVWTDVIQTSLMVGAMILVAVKGAMDTGGFGVVWDRCYESGRLEVPSFSLDFTERHTMWGVSIATLIHMLQSSFINQNMIQRYMALPTLTSAKKALWIFTFGITFFLFICSFCGLVAYATYHDCDPLTTKLAKAKDQILPLLVMTVLGDYPGMPGLFVAGIFSAALSSLSTGLNSMAAVVLEDFIKPFISTKLNDRIVNVIMKSVVLFFGVLCVALVFIVEKLGTVLQLSISLGSMTYGPLFGVFCGGMLLPWMNEKGAFYGGLLGLGSMAFVILGAQNAMANGQLRFPGKPVTTAGCTYMFNATVATTAIPTFEEETYVFPLFRLSYLWYTSCGGLITITLAMIISYFTGFRDLTKIDPLCVSPVIRKHLPRRKSILHKKEEEELINMLKKDQDALEKNLDGEC